MAIKLDEKDRQIINELWSDARQGDSAIAKHIGASREVVRYRIERLEKLGAIKRYITLVDTAKLGYITFNIYLRLQNFDIAKEKEIIGIIKNNPHVKWLIDMSGQYDLFFVMVARSRAELDNQLTDMYGKFEKHVADNLILSSIKIYKDLEFFYPKNKPKRTKYSETVETQPETESVELKDTDYNILDIISVNARINVVDIAKELSKRKIEMTPEAVAYRLKRLEESKIIRGYRVVLDYTKLGYQWYMLLMNLTVIPKLLEMKIKEELKQNKKVIYSDKVLGEWDIRIELLVKDHDEFHEELLKIRNMVSGGLNRYELFLVFNDYTMVSFTEGMFKAKTAKSA